MSVLSCIHKILFQLGIVSILDFGEKIRLQNKKRILSAITKKKELLHQHNVMNNHQKIFTDNHDNQITLPVKNTRKTVSLKLNHVQSGSNSKKYGKNIKKKITVTKSSVGSTKTR